MFAYLIVILLGLTIDEAMTSLFLHSDNCEWQESNLLFKGYEPFVIFRFTPPQFAQ
ncbi:orf79 [Lactobacillus phage LP65]|uniref:Orf79 n=1 Tax=Lactobacillus phage LP65 TaxID=2892344 RepID=Q5ULN5_9CAUD|nr:hypothetical protein LP65_gp079 [Lactobacillus phage LP65]AAV35899.1 orf79 [Lactobacillus phage LP65]